MIEQLQDFHFLRPEWLLALLPLLFLLWVMRYLQRQQSGWQGILAGHLYQHLISHKQQKYKPPLWMLALGWIIAVVALAGPAWEKLPQPVYQLHTGKVIVMDMSLSMRATDVKPDRLTRARYKAIDLINAVAEGETGLVAYAGDAFLISPLSTDSQNLTSLLPSLSPEIMPVKGSEPYLGLKMAADLLTNAGYQQGEIFWVTDGVELNQVAEINQLVADVPFRISVLGVGTEQGAPVKLTDGELLKDRKGAIVVPKLKAAKLKAIANKSLGRYAPLQADDRDIEYLTSPEVSLQQQTQQEEQEQEQNFGDKWQEAGPYLLLLLLPFAAYSFRRGILTCLPLLLMLPIYSPQTQANWWQDMWKTPNQQGQEAFDKQEYAKASELFEDPLWQGAAAYENGDFQQAADAFSQVDTANGWYNLGNSLAKMQKLDEAIKAYDKALEKQPQHSDAKFNKELLEKMKQQQDNQQQQDSEQQQQDDQQQQNSEQQQQDDQQQQNSEQQQQDDQQQQNSEQQQQDDQQQQNSEQQQQDDQQQQNSEQQQQDNQQQQNSEQQQQKDNQQQQNSEQQQQKDNQQQQNSEQQQQDDQQQELTEEQKEQMQKMQNLLRKVPDDPAYLLKRKMQLEHQQRRRQRIPNQQQRNW